jgi:hypothetical protein
MAVDADHKASYLFSGKKFKKQNVVMGLFILILTSLRAKALREEMNLCVSQHHRYRSCGRKLHFRWTGYEQVLSQTIQEKKRPALSRPFC